MDFLDIIERTRRMEANYTVTPFVYETFKKLSNDLNPLHIDDAFAHNMGFQEKVMYGNILNCFVSHFVGVVIPSFLPSFLPMM